MNQTLGMSIQHRIGTLSLNFEASTGASCIAIEGPSGCGKSTLLRVLAGLTRPEQATIRYKGVLWQGPGVFVPPWKRGLGYAPQEPLLFPHLTVRGNLTYGINAKEYAEQTMQLSDELKLAHLLNRFPRQLSGGEKQRVALGRALLNRPGLLLLDEPFSAQDRPLRDAMKEHLKMYVRQIGCTVVLVSHNTEDHTAFVDERFNVVRSGSDLLLSKL